MATKATRGSKKRTSARIKDLTPRKGLRGGAHIPQGVPVPPRPAKRA